MLEWFIKLSSAEQIAIVAAILSALATSLVAILGFSITVWTSTSANRQIIARTRDLSIRQIRMGSAAKIAEFRVAWIDGFRNELSEHTRLVTELLMLRVALRKKLIAKSEYENKTNELKLRSIALRGKMLLRLDPKSNDSDEKKLASILLKGLDRSTATANKDRKTVVRLSRGILKREWDKIKSELEHTSTGV